MKVGITGAGGNVGSTLVKGLAAKYDLTLYDIKAITQTYGHDFIKINFAEKNDLKDIFNGLDSIVHLAGDPRPDASTQSTLMNNFLATSLVFEGAKQAGVKKIVFASSNFYHQGDIADYMRGRLQQRITLDREPTPQCLYAKSKVFAENIGLHLSHLGMQFIALRIGWTVPQDNPALYGGNYMRAVFCSHRDLIQAFGRALQIDTSFLTAFAVSDNDDGVFDLAESKETLGFYPQDNSGNIP